MPYGREPSKKHVECFAVPLMYVQDVVPISVRTHSLYDMTRSLSAHGVSSNQRWPSSNIAKNGATFSTVVECHAFTCRRMKQVTRGGDCASYFQVKSTRTQQNGPLVWSKLSDCTRSLRKLLGQGRDLMTQSIRIGTVESPSPNSAAVPAAILDRW